MLINLLFVLKQKIDDIHKQKYLKHKSLNVSFPCRLSNTNNACSASYWVYEAPLSNDSLDMDKKEKIIISPEAERHHKPKINKPLIAVLILGKTYQGQERAFKVRKPNSFGIWTQWQNDAFSTSALHLGPISQHMLGDGRRGIFSEFR